MSNKLSTRQIKKAVALHEKGQGLTATEVDAILANRVDEEIPGLTKLTKWGVATGIVGHIAGGAVVETRREHLPRGFDISGFGEAALSAAYNFLPGEGVPVDSPYLRDHLANIALLATYPLAIFEASRFGNYIKKRRLGKQFEATQKNILEQKSLGILQWRITPGSTMAFVGNGDTVANELIHRRATGAGNGLEVHQIAYGPVESGPWTYIPRNADRYVDATVEAMSLANLEEAGELLFLPTNTWDEFLPKPSDHDISLDRLIHYINTADAYCRSKNKPLKPVIVVGSKLLSENYGRVFKSYSDSQPQYEEPDRMRTLEGSLEYLSYGGSRAVEVYDPTEIVMQRILQIAEGRPLDLAGTEGSMAEYEEMFFYYAQSESTDYTKPHVRVLYNNNDFPTVHKAKKDDIIVLLDASQKQVLIDWGIPEERIIVVSEEVLKVVAPIMAST